MGKIVLARIDDRLIHGQVMTAWIQFTNANEVIVMDEKVAQDPFLADIITSAVPENLKAMVLSPVATAAYLKQQAGQPVNHLLLAKGPQAYLDLLDQGIALNSIDLGGMGQTGQRTQLYRNIALDETERAAFRELIQRQVNVYIQVAPANKKINLAKI
jgi:PTS system mannose-specific IIB component